MNTGTPKPISIQSVTKVFTARTGDLIEALLPITFDVEEGEFVSIVGPSGCGKSTLLNILAGFERPTAGQITVGDRPVVGPHMDRGMVFQSYALFPWRNVLQNVEFGLEQKKMPKVERTRIAMRFLETVGLAGFANRQIDELSGGMKQRVAIARAFAADPSIILMDEPFGALDALSRRSLQHELLRTWQENRKTIIFITHSVSEAVYLSDRVLVMSARPGSIRSSFDIEMPHPRDSTSQEFREVERQIYTILDEELLQTSAIEKRPPVATR